MRKYKDEMEVRLSKGSTYIVTSLGTREANTVTNGTFIGFTSIGSDEGFCMEMGKEHGDLKGKIRVVPLHMILSIDLLKQNEEKENADRGEDTTTHYFG